MNIIHTQKRQVNTLTLALGAGKAHVASIVIYDGETDKSSISPELLGALMAELGLAPEGGSSPTDIVKEWKELSGVAEQQEQAIDELRNQISALETNLGQKEELIEKLSDDLTESREANELRAKELIILRGKVAEFETKAPAKLGKPEDEVTTVKG